MKQKISLLIAMLVLSFAAMAQRTLTEAEVQNFYQLIKQTKEYQAVKAQTDSVNNSNKSNAPQELNIEMLKQDLGTDSNIFWAEVKRTLMGMPMGGYKYSYDQQKKKIVAVEKIQSRFRAN